jgi:hypothetical protein
MVILHLPARLGVVDALDGCNQGSQRLRRGRARLKTAGSPTARELPPRQGDGRRHAKATLLLPRSIRRSSCR